MRKNVILAVVAATVVGMLHSMAPDLKRYVKMSAMYLVDLSRSAGL